jgi:hypothetical protein
MRKRLLLPAILGSLLAITAAIPAQAAIHEIVGSHCSGQGLRTLDPPGQVRFGEQSFLRALQASGVYTIRFGEEPDGTLNPGAVTVDVDFTRPNVKFADAGFYFSFVEPELGLTVFIRAGVPDHPAFANCPNFPGG